MVNIILQVAHVHGVYIILHAAHVHGEYYIACGSCAWQILYCMRLTCTVNIILHWAHVHGEYYIEGLKLMNNH